MEQLTLGELIDELKSINPMTDYNEDKTIRYDFGWFVPTKIHSWRGDYSHIGIGYSNQRDFEDMTVKKFIKLLESANNQKYEGYKGGMYRMNLDTPLWVDNYGDVCDTAIIGITDIGHAVIIKTAYWEY